jgi:prevent-host-death family protein
MEITVRDLRQNLAKVLSKAEQGEEITVTRNGEAIVKLVSSKQNLGIDLEQLAAFREDLGLKSKRNPVLSLRKEERF